eukprot:8142350-Alexandrium_andersonii.AAC.1
MAPLGAGPKVDVDYRHAPIPHLYQEPVCSPRRLKVRKSSSDRFTVEARQPRARENSDAPDWLFQTL